MDFGVIFIVTCLIVGAFAIWLKTKHPDVAERLEKGYCKKYDEVCDDYRSRQKRNNEKIIGTAAKVFKLLK